MVERIFDPVGLVVLAVLGGAGALLGLLVAKTRTPSESALWRCIEAPVLAVLGGLLARTFISLLLGAGNDSPGIGLAVGWGFFLVPGIVDTFVMLGGSGPALTAPDTLLMFATVVGGFSGMMNGIWRIYDWTGFGWLAFPLDVTWALAGNTVGCLLHIVNFAWGDHSNEQGRNAHRYASGFGLRYNPRYAFTQGAVMSNLTEGVSDAGVEEPLYHHEKTHVLQNRAFGPLYTLTYIGWMLLWLIPSLIVGVVKLGASGLFRGPNNWCYFSNPWEAWAYKVQGAPRSSIQGVEAADADMMWSDGAVIGWAIPFYLVMTSLAVLGTVEAFSDTGPAVAAKHKQSAPAHAGAPAKSAPAHPHASK
jgi:hypothetical protein